MADGIDEAARGGPRSYDVAELSRRFGVPERDVRYIASRPELGLPAGPGKGRRQTFGRAAALRVGIAASLKRAGVNVPDAASVAAWAADAWAAALGRYAGGPFAASRSARTGSDAWTLELADGERARLLRVNPRPETEGRSRPPAVDVTETPWSDLRPAETRDARPRARGTRPIVLIAVDLTEVVGRLLRASPSPAGTGPPGGEARPDDARGPDGGGDVFAHGGLLERGDVTFYRIRGPRPRRGTAAAVEADQRAKAPAAARASGGSEAPHVRPPAARPPFPTDLSDEEWARVEPLVRSPAGRPPESDRRLLIDTILFKLTTGRPWRDLPAYLPRWEGAHSALWRWRRDGVWEELVSRLDHGRPGFEDIRFPGPF